MHGIAKKEARNTVIDLAINPDVSIMGSPL